LRAAFLRTPGALEVGDFAIPEPGAAGQVLVRMLLASICGSDVHSVYHDFHNPDEMSRPGYPGHEGVGEVVASRSASFRPGELVLTLPFGFVGGCFAEYQVLDESQLIELPAGGDPARLLMAQQLGTTIFAMRRFAADQVSGVAAVIGVGSAGLFFLQQLRALGFATIVVSDLSQERLKVAADLGADVLVQAPLESLPSVVMDVSAGVGADLVVEAAGYDRCRADAIEAIRPAGTAGYFGFPQRYGDAPFPSYTAFRKSARVEWVSGAQDEPRLRSFREAVGRIQEGTVEIGYCLGNSYPLERLPEAIEIARDQGRGAVKLTVEIARGG
jgi:L-iditol 2-dehydrogenase